MPKPIARRTKLVFVSCGSNVGNSSVAYIYLAWSASKWSNMTIKIALNRIDRVTDQHNLVQGAFRAEIVLDRRPFPNLF